MWFRDIFYIPSYVREANWMSDMEYLQQMSVHQKYNRAPAFGLRLFAYQFTSGTIMSRLISCLGPSGSPDVLTWTLEAVGAALGVYYGTFESVSKNSKASLPKILVAAILVRLVSQFESVELSAELSASSTTCVLVCVITYYFTRDWVLRADDVIQELEAEIPRKKKRGSNGFLRYCGLILVMVSIFSTGLIQHGKIETVDPATGHRVKYTVRETCYNMINSPAFTEFSSTVKTFYGYVRSQGFLSGWEHVKKCLDPSGKKRAYRDLELAEDATKEEIKAAHRRLALKYHPDKVTTLSEYQQAKAQEKFIKIQEAYKILSKRPSKEDGHDEL